MNGIFAIYKPVGPTSHDVIDQLRHKTGIKKIGHAGTLDPLAKGVLVVAIGREATKKLSAIVKMEKEYMAKMAMEKNEVESQGKELTKSESEIELEKIKVENDKLKAENTELMKKSEDGEAVQEEFAKFVKLLEGDEAAPSQKSITNMDFIAKNEDGSEGSGKKPVIVEEMSKTEVSEILAKKSADPETNAKDRKAINSYILENTDINEIKHLLQGE